MNGKPQSDRSGQKSTHVQTLKRLRGGPKSSCQAISSPRIILAPCHRYGSQKASCLAGIINQNYKQPHEPRSYIILKVYRNIERDEIVTWKTNLKDAHLQKVADPQQIQLICRWYKSYQLHLSEYQLLLG